MARNNYYHSTHWRDLRKEAIRRAGGQCTVPGCLAKGTHVDHIETRPNVDEPTPFDVIGNLRILCVSHDAQIKEKANGERRRGGNLKVKGCDESGWPADPAHSWRG